MCIPKRIAHPDPPIFRIILHWNQTLFQDHLALDNSVVKSLPLSAVRWLVVAVVIYTASMMLRSAVQERRARVGAVAAEA